MFVCRGHYGPVRCLAYHPESATAYSGSEDITIKGWRAEKTEESTSYQVHQGPATAIAFSSDGSALVSVGLDGAIWHIDPTGKQQPRLLHREQRPLRQACFLPGSRTIFVTGGDDEPGHDDGSICLLDLQSGVVTGRLGTDLAAVRSLSITSNGRRMAVVGRTSNHSSVVQIWNLQSRTPDHYQVPAELLPGEPVAARLFAGGNKLVVMLDQLNDFMKPSYVLIDLSGGPRAMPTTRLALGGPIFAEFSKDESSMFLGGRDGGFNKFQVTPRGFFNLARYSGHGGMIHSGALSPDEMLLATASDDETVRLWNTDIDREQLVLHGDRSPMNCVAFSPDGNFIAAAQGSGAIHIWDGRPRPQSGAVSGPR